MSADFSALLDNRPPSPTGCLQIVVHTSSVAGGGTAGNVCLDLTGDASSSGVLTLRNKGGSFRPGQVGREEGTRGWDWRGDSAGEGQGQGQRQGVQIWSTFS